MATPLSRWNPFKPMVRLDPLANFEDVFRSLGSRALWRELEAAPDMRIDVTENDKAFSVRAELPGVDKDAIEVSVEGNQVSISAEVKRETTRKEEEREIYTERYYGKIFRSFALPAEVDSERAEAHYAGGVLALSLPKKGDGSTRRIAVS